MRRSNRRLTITGSSVFSASTPVVSNNDESFGGSPKWVSAEEALTFKTPKFTKMTRRTTMTRQNIFEVQDTIQEADENRNEGFRRPTLLLISPPGVKTRSRRSSMFVGKDHSNNNSAAARKGPLTKTRKANNAFTKYENKVVEKASKTVKKTNDEKTSSLAKDKDAFSPAGRKTGIKRPADRLDSGVSSPKKISPSLDVEVASANIKKVSRKSARHVECLDVEVSKTTTVAMQDIQTPRGRTKRQSNAQLQKIVGSSEAVDSKDVEQPGKMGSQTPENNSLDRVEKGKIRVKESAKKTPNPDTLSTTDKIDVKETAKKTPKSNALSSKDKIDVKDTAKKTPKPNALSTIDKTEVKETTKKTPKPNALFVKDKIEKKQSDKTFKTDCVSTPREKSSSLKRWKQDDANDEIDVVVKKMFSPSSFYSSKSLKSSSKFTSPNTVKSVSSPARAAIVRETLNVRDRSETKSPGRRYHELGSAKKTPSRAAPKARKILGVATPCNINNSSKECIENAEVSLDMSDRSMTSKTEEKISFEIEDENNMTLSHTSHSQWCTIL